MNRIDRLMGMLTLLQSKKHRTLAQLAKHFGVSERTVFRDLRAIGEIGIPVHFEAEKGYSVGSGFFLPPVSLTLEEANALTLAEPLVLRFADRSILQHFASALAKIKMVLSGQQQEKMEQAQAGAAHFVPDQYAHLMPSTEFLSPLQNAISHQQIIRIEYENLQGESSLRELEPIGLTFYSLNWHLIAWCHLRQEYRDFRVSRIKKLTETKMPFRKKAHLSLQAYLQEIQQELLEKPEHPLT